MHQDRASGPPEWLLDSILRSLNDLHRSLGRLEAMSDANREMLTSHIAALANHVAFHSNHLEKLVRDVSGQTTRFEQVHVPALHRQIGLTSAGPTTSSPSHATTPPPSTATVKRVASKLTMAGLKELLPWLLGRVAAWLLPYVLPVALALLAYGKSILAWMGLAWRALAG